MASTVYLINKHPLPDLKGILEKQFRQKFSEGENIIVKAHLGEYGNLNYIRPPIIGAVVEELKKTGAKPIVFDTTTWYRGSRHTSEDYRETARKNGFTEETIGCPLAFSDESVKIDGLRLYDKIGVAKKITGADGMVVVSHVKGHEDASFGGAIKNLGMGAVDSETKKLAHTESRPHYGGGCVECGACEKACPYGIITVSGEPRISLNGCYGCNACVRACAQGCLTSRGSVREFIAEAAAAALSGFAGKRVVYLNALVDASRHCDCLASRADDFGGVLYPDIGFLVSDDIVAIEQCTLDLINKATENENFFLSQNQTDPLEQVEAAEKLGLGSRDYNLEGV